MFFDEHAVQFFDEEHSDEEDQFILLGMNSLSRILIVCHCEQLEGQVIWIISARKATNSESGFYPQGAR